MFQIILFVVLSAVILYVSRATLRAPRSHGFQRFFAWEFMAALFSGATVGFDVIFSVESAFSMLAVLVCFTGWLLVISQMATPKTINMEAAIDNGLHGIKRFSFVSMRCCKRWVSSFKFPC